MNKVERAIGAIWSGRAKEDDLVRLYRAYIYRLALSITVSCDAAEDVTQEVCCRLVRSRSKLEAAENPLAWVRKVTVRCASSAMARRFEPEITKETLARTADPNEAIAVAQVLSKLSPDHRTILALSIFEGLSYQEIADTLGIPMGSVASRMHNAKERFRQLWEKE